MKHDAPPLPGRRHFLGQGGALMLGFWLGPGVAVAASARPSTAHPTPTVFSPNAFVRIGPDSSVTVISKQLEMGQGVFTGLATLLAEELDADWNAVRVEGAPADSARYANLELDMQATGASSSISNGFMQMRQAGAITRALLVAAAARQWQVPTGEITVVNGMVTHAASGRHSAFGALIGVAATVPFPPLPTIKLKDPSQFKLIGNPRLRRIDGHAKTNGLALYTQDLQLPGMLVAVAAHPSRFGATLAGFDATAAHSVDGVAGVVRFGAGPHVFEGVAVLAANTWTAMRGRDALRTQWDESRALRIDSVQLAARYRELAASPGVLARQVGDDAPPPAGAPVPAAADAAAERTLEADYELPYLAHAAMEPMNCLVQVTDTDLSIWNGEQLQSADQAAIAALAGVAPEHVHLTQLYVGGSFGRRANPHSDYLLEAVAIARAAAAAGHRVPVKLMWTREQDTRGGYYRPACLHRITATLDAGGALVRWQQRTVTQSMLAGSPFAARIKDGIDPTSVEGSAEPYEIPNVRIELVTPTEPGVPVQWWRSAGHSHTAFATECMIDELAAAAGQDPYAFRRTLLASHPRELAVLDLVAAKAGWSKPQAPANPAPNAPAALASDAAETAGATAVPTVATRGPRRGRGLALHSCYGTCVAQVAEVTVDPNGTLHVDRIVCAIDCGLAVNPDIIASQMESGIGYGLGAALQGRITLQDGVVQQADFDDYPPLRIGEMPAIEVYVVPSQADPSGVGEPGTPPIAPAVVNAIFNATGVRIRHLPIGNQLRAAAAAGAPSVPASTSPPDAAPPAAADAPTPAPAGT